MTVRVLIADDHPVVVNGLRSAVDATGIEIVGIANSAESIRELLVQTFPDVLVTEVRLGGQDALKAVEELMGDYPDLSIVVFSSCDNPTIIARAASLGCHDYILKTQQLESLVSTILSAASGAARSAESLLTITCEKIRRPRQMQDGAVPLTNREMQVLRHIAMGLSNRATARSLEIAEGTVKEHVQNILRKMDFNDRTQAAVWAIRQGIV
jgi:DNA-binding NarL/FixJ family response regulator